MIAPPYKFPIRSKLLFDCEKIGPDQALNVDYFLKFYSPKGLRHRAILQWTILKLFMGTAPVN